MDLLVTTEWLAGELGAPDLRILDASFYLAADGRKAPSEYEAAHIPGAVFFDLEQLADRHSPHPGMLPQAEPFAAAMEVLGVSDSDRIIVYDNSPHHSSARAWWMLKSFGAANVAILDGGLQKWTAEGRPVESGAPKAAAGRFSAGAGPAWLATKVDVAEAIDAASAAIVDARSTNRFAGADPEPRPGVEPGHIPTSRNLPQGRLFNPDSSYKRGEVLRAAFVEAGIDLERPMITTCGSGVTAAIVLVGAHLLGKTDVRLYDGSWSEWGSDPGAPKAIGST